MIWQHLNPIPVEDFFSKKLISRVTGANEAIARVKAERERIDGEIARVTSPDTPMHQIDLDNLIMVPLLRDSIVAALQAELSVRMQIKEVLAEIRKEREAAWEKAVKATGEITEKIRESLVSLGYVHVPHPDRPVIGRILPGWISVHPKVFAAQQNQDALRTQMATIEPVQQNRDAIEKIESLLRERIAQAARL